MKQKTKILTLLITIFVIGMAMSAFAAGKTTLTANVSGDTSNGGEITVKLDLAESQKLGGLQSTLTYDKTKLQYVSGALTDDFKASATVGSFDVVDGENGVGIAVVFNDPSNYNGTIAEVKFKVLAQKGEAVEVNLTSELADIDYNEMTVENKPAKFTVKIPMTAIAIEGDASRTMVKGEKITLSTKISPDNTTETNKKVIWTSSDENVAKVTPDGVVTAVGGGKAVITATTEVGGLTAKANVTVNVKLEGIAIGGPIGASTNTIEEGKTLQLNVVMMPADVTDKLSKVEWKSSDESVAKIDANGLVTAVKTGDVKITAKANGFTTELSVKVTAPKTEEPKATEANKKPEATTAKVQENATVNGKESKTGDTFNGTTIIVMLAVGMAAVGAAAVGKKRTVEK